MLIDIRTVIFFTIIFNFMFGVGMLIFNSQGNTFRGVRLIGLGFITSSFGLVLMFLRDIISPFFSIVICNIAILLGIIMVFRGIATFYEKKLFSLYFDALILLVFSLVYYYYYDINPNIKMRIIIVTLSLSFYYILSYIVITQNPKYNIKSSKIFMGGYLILNTSYAFFRIFITIFEDSSANFMDASLVHSISIIMFAMLALVICFSIFIVINQVIHDELILQAKIDTLTGLFNRRALADIFTNTNDKNIDSQLHNSIAMCDIDDFKHINDTYGHEVGDLILKEVASRLKKVTRANDILIRYGGDEFIIFLPDTDCEESKTICKNIKNEFTNLVVDKIHKNLKITLSIGLHSYSYNNSNWQEHIKSADSALYMAKKNGKNQYVTSCQADEIMY